MSLRFGYLALVTSWVATSIIGCAPTQVVGPKTATAAEPRPATASTESKAPAATAEPRPAASSTPAWTEADPRKVEEAVCLDKRDNDQDGLEDCDDPDCQSPGGDCVPAPPLDRTVASTMREQTELLLVGDNPLQRNLKPGLALGTSAVGGTVLGPDKQPLPGVRVTIEGHPELGYTYTRASGRYDLVVHSGLHQRVRFELSGYQPLTRPFLAEVERWVVLDTVGLASRNQGVTTVLRPRSQDCQAARSNEVEYAGAKFVATLVAEAETPIGIDDARGFRETNATTTIAYYLVREGETFVPRAARASGGHSMGAFRGSDTTVELTVAEAAAGPSSEVRPRKTMTLFMAIPLADKLGIISGHPNPNATDRSARPDLPRGVVRVLEVKKGRAKLDADGDSRAESASELDALGISECDLERVAEIYSRGELLYFEEIAAF